jgi:hypothetical protein
MEHADVPNLRLQRRSLAGWNMTCSNQRLERDLKRLQTAIGTCDVPKAPWNRIW